MPVTRTFRGLSSAAAAARLSRSIRGILAADARRIVNESTHERLQLVLRHTFSLPNVVLLLAAVALFVAYGYGTDAGGRWASESSILVAALAVCVSVCVSVCLVLLRAHRLRWEVHGHVWDALLEFERAMCVSESKSAAGGTAGMSSPVASPIEPPPTATSATVDTCDGIVTRVQGLWEVLNFEDHGRTVHALLVYRDARWTRMPVSLLVKGDLIALMSHETAPCKVRAVDGTTLGRRSSHTGLYKELVAAERANTVGSTATIESAPGTPAHTTMNAAGQVSRDKDVAALTLCSDMRRFVLEETPAAAMLSKRLRQPHRPQALVMTQLRTWQVLALRWQVVLAVLATIVVIIRSVITEAVPDGEFDSDAGAPGVRTGFGAYVGLLGGLLQQVPTLLIVTSAVSLPALLVLAEAIGTAHMLAVHEAAAVRSKWKEWRRSIMLDRVHAQQAAAAATRARELAEERRTTREAVASRHSRFHLGSVPEVAAVVHEEEASTTPGRWQSFQAAVARAFRRRPSVGDASVGAPDETASATAPPSAPTELATSASMHEDGDGAGGLLEQDGSAPAASMAAQFISEGDAPEGTDRTDAYNAADAFGVTSARGSGDLGGVFESDGQQAVSSPHSLSREVIPVESPTGRHGTDSSRRLWSHAYAATQLLSMSRRWIATRRGRHGQPSARSAYDLTAEDAEAVETGSAFGEDGESVRTRLTTGRDRYTRAGVSRQGPSVHDAPRRLPASVLAQRERERILRETRRIRADVGDVDDRFECVPIQYTPGGVALGAAPAVTPSSTFIVEDASRRALSAALPSSLTAAKISDSSAHAAAAPAPPATRWCCCCRSPPVWNAANLRRVFSGPTFSQISSLQWRAVSWRRLVFYLWRVLFDGPTRHQPGSSQAKSTAGGATHTVDEDARRWSNRILNDDMIDVGFGLSPIPTPLLGTQLAFRLGASTVFCAADRNTVTECEPVVENVMVLKGESASAIIDLHADDTSVTGLRFDDKHWLQHLSSLKPIGLACLLGARREQPGSSGAVEHEAAPQAIEPAAGRRGSFTGASSMLADVQASVELREQEQAAAQPITPDAEVLRAEESARRSPVTVTEAPQAEASLLAAVETPREIAVAAANSAPTALGDAAVTGETLQTFDGDAASPVAGTSPAESQPSRAMPEPAGISAASLGRPPRAPTGRLAAGSRMLDKWRQSIRGGNASPAASTSPGLHGFPPVAGGDVGGDVSAGTPPLRTVPSHASPSDKAAQTVSTPTSLALSEVDGLDNSKLSVGENAMGAPPTSAKPRTSALRSFFRRDSSHSAAAGVLRVESDVPPSPAAAGGALTIMKMLAPLTNRRRTSREGLRDEQGRGEQQAPGDATAQNASATGGSAASVRAGDETDTDSEDVAASEYSYDSSDTRTSGSESGSDSSTSSGSSTASSLLPSPRQAGARERGRGRSEPSLDESETDDDADSDVDEDELADGRKRVHWRRRRRHHRHRRARQRSAPDALERPASAEPPRQLDSDEAGVEQAAGVSPEHGLGGMRNALGATTKCMSEPASPARGIRPPRLDTSELQPEPVGTPNTVRRASLVGTRRLISPIGHRAPSPSLHSTLAGDLQLSLARHASFASRRALPNAGGELRPVRSSTDLVRLALQGALRARRSTEALLAPEQDAVAVVVGQAPVVAQNDEYLVLAPPGEESSVESPTSVRTFAARHEVAVAGKPAIALAPPLEVSPASAVLPGAPQTPIELAATALFEHASETGSLVTANAAPLLTDRRHSRRHHRTSQRHAPHRATVGTEQEAGVPRKPGARLKVAHRVNVANLLRQEVEQIKADDYASLRALARAVEAVPPRIWLAPLAREMGFTPGDEAIFAHVRHVHTLVATEIRAPAGAGGRGTRRPTAVPRPPGATGDAFRCEPVAPPRAMSPAAARHIYMPRSRREPWLNPALTATVVRDSRTNRMQMLSQGNLPFLLANCSDYWDGSTIWPLTKQRRTALLAMYQQWRAEDLFCVGLSYDPVSNQEVALFDWLDKSLHSPTRAGPTPIGGIHEDHQRTEAMRVGLASDRQNIFLVSRAGEHRLNAQADARQQQHAMGASTANLALDSVPSHPAGPGPRAAPVSAIEDRLWRMQSGQVFVGMVAARYQPRPKMQNVIKDLTEAGVRFVYMAQRNYRRVRPLAQKMGLETGWNCAISLLPRRLKSPSQLASTSTRVHGVHGSQGAKSGLGEYEVDEDEEDFGVEGVLSDEKRWRMLRSTVDEQVWDMKAQLPHGVPEIRTHLQEKDNVPLLVSLFTDCTPPASAGMLRIMQENGEQVLVIASALRKSSFLLFSVADVSVAVAQAQYRAPLTLRALIGQPAMNVDRPVFSSCLPISLRRRAVYAGTLALPLELQHPALRFASTLASLHCAFVLPADRGLGLVLKILADSRRFIAAFRQMVVFVGFVQAALSLQVLATICTAMPQALPASHTMWLLWIVLPLIALPIVLAPPEEGAMSEDRTPMKRDENGLPVWDILPGPAAPSTGAQPLPDIPLFTSVGVDGGSRPTAEGAAYFEQPAVPATADRDHPHAAVDMTAPSVSGEAESHYARVDSLRRLGSTGSSHSQRRHSSAAQHQDGDLHADDVAVAVHDDGDAHEAHGEYAGADAGLDDLTHEAPIVFADEPEGDAEVPLPPTWNLTGAAGVADETRSPMALGPLAGVHHGSDESPQHAQQQGAASIQPGGVMASTQDHTHEAADAAKGASSIEMPQPASRPHHVSSTSVLSAPDVDHFLSRAPPVSATNFNPVTGGVRAESLIRYGSYIDMTSSIAGHSVELSDASARKIRKIILAATDAGASPLAAAGSAQAAAFTQGIAPSQGLLARPPRPHMPMGARTFVLMLLAAVLPAVVFHEYLLSRVVEAYLLTDAGIASPLEAGRYPLVAPVAPPGGFPDIVNNAAFAAATAWAQATILFSWVMWMVAASAHFMYRSHPVWRQSPFRNSAWLAGAVAALVCQIVYSHVLCVVNGAPTIFSSALPSDVWGSVMGFQVVSFFWLAYCKTWDARRYERVLALLRAYFDTRLGMYSPR